MLGVKSSIPSISTCPKKFGNDKKERAKTAVTTTKKKVENDKIKEMATSY